MKRSPLAARRQASVATERARWTLRRLSFSAQTCSAASARSFSEAYDPAERVDDREILARWARDQQAAIIGAEIERGIGLASRPPGTHGRRERCNRAGARVAALVFGLGGALVAEIGYLAGRAAPSLASP
jgi:hypothetical protein